MIISARSRYSTHCYLSVHQQLHDHLPTYIIMLLSLLFSIHFTSASPLIYVVYGVGSLFNTKIKQGLNGRIGGLGKPKDFVQTIGNDKKLIFIHSSSVGEWEQSVQIIRQLKQKRKTSYSSRVSSRLRVTMSSNRKI